MGPKLGAETAVRLGRAAHITAAARGGPRYDDSLTATQRRGFDNGIWLCVDHADEIDADHERFTAPEIRRWKTLAEASAQEEIGRPLPLRSDAVNQAIALIGGDPGRFLQHGIQNTHEAMSRALSAMDPAVAAYTEYVAGTTHIHLSARSPVEVTFEGQGDAGARLDQAIGSVMRDGAEVTIPMPGIKVVGSKVFEVLMSGAESLTVGAVPSEAILRLTARGEADMNFTVELRGSARMGEQAITVDAEGFGGVLRTSLRWPFSPDGPSQKWAMSFSFSPWDGLPVTELPHFDRAHRLLRAQRSDVPMGVELEVDGHRLFETRSTGPTQPPAYAQIAAAFSYIADAREVSKFTGKSILTHAGFDVSRQDAKNLADLADTLGTITHPRRLTTNDALTLRLQPDINILDALREPGPRAFKIVAPRHSVKVFQQSISVPPLTTVLSMVELRIRGSETRKLKKGGVITLDVVPSAGSMMTTWRT